MTRTNRLGLRGYKRVRKELVPPFRQLGTEQIYWPRDLLPEFLWIDALVQSFGTTHVVKVFNDFLDLLDPYNPSQQEILIGTVGMFRDIPREAQEEFRRKYADQIEVAVARPFAHVLSLDDECPMRWLVPQLEPMERKNAIEITRNAIMRLLPGKDEYTAFCRAIPLNRYFAHNKIVIFNTLQNLIKSIKEYPRGDRLRAEAFARSTVNMDLARRAQQNPHIYAWARYFWNQNRTLVACILQ